MTITLLPHQEKAIEAAINAGVIHSVEELIDSAIAHLPAPPTLSSEPTRPRTGQDLIDACAKVRGLLTDEEVDTFFRRAPSSARPVDFE